MLRLHRLGFASSHAARRRPGTMRYAHRVPAMTLPITRAPACRSTPASGALPTAEPKAQPSLAAPTSSTGLASMREQRGSASAMASLPPREASPAVTDMPGAHVRLSKASEQAANAALARRGRLPPTHPLDTSVAARRSDAEDVAPPEIMACDAGQAARDRRRKMLPRIDTSVAASPQPASSLGSAATLVASAEDWSASTLSEDSPPTLKKRDLGLADSTSAAIGDGVKHGPVLELPTDNRLLLRSAEAVLRKRVDPLFSRIERDPGLVEAKMRGAARYLNTRGLAPIIKGIKGIKGKISGPKWVTDNDMRGASESDGKDAGKVSAPHADD